MTALYIKADLLDLGMETPDGEIVAIMKRYVERSRNRHGYESRRHYSMRIEFEIGFTTYGNPRQTFVSRNDWVHLTSLGDKEWNREWLLEKGFLKYVPIENLVRSTQSTRLRREGESQSLLHDQMENRYR